MQFFATKYSHVNERMERISDKFDTYKEAFDWIETNGPRNVDGECIAMVGHDYYAATDYPMSAELVAENAVLSYDDINEVLDLFLTVETVETVVEVKRYKHNLNYWE